MLYAHSENNDGVLHTLEDHSIHTANLAEDICKVERLKDIAYMLGLCHDLGKAYQEFQDRLTGKNKESFNHPGMSIVLIRKYFPELLSRERLEEIISGHHRGLNIAIPKDYLLEERLGVPAQVEKFVESMKPYTRQMTKQKVSYHDSLYLAGCLFCADWQDTGKHFQTYIKRQRNIQLDVKESIEKYVNSLIK